MFNCDAFETAVRRTTARSGAAWAPDRAVRIDMSAASFWSHQPLYCLERLASRFSCTVELLGAPASAKRLMEVLEPERVRSSS